MIRLLRPHASYANVIATIALFVALGGSATVGQIEGGSLLDGGQVSVLQSLSNPNLVYVFTYDKTGTASDRWFHLGAFC